MQATEVARTLGVSVQLVRNKWVKQPGCPFAVKVTTGGSERRMFDPVELAAWAAEHANSSKAAAYLGRVGGRGRYPGRRGAAAAPSAGPGAGAGSGAGSGASLGVGLPPADAGPGFADAHERLRAEEAARALRAQDPRQILAEMVLRLDGLVTRITPDADGITAHELKNAVDAAAKLCGEIRQLTRAIEEREKESGKLVGVDVAERALLETGEVFVTALANFASVAAADIAAELAPRAHELAGLDEAAMRRVLKPMVEQRVGRLRTDTAANLRRVRVGEERSGDAA